MSKIWATSDWHLGHKNIVKYEPSRAENFAEVIQANIFNTISPGDRVYFLGDLCFGNTKPYYDLIVSLTSICDWYFIRGNHDKSLRVGTIKNLGFVDVADNCILESKQYGKSLLSHYPISNHDPRYVDRVAMLYEKFLAEKCTSNIHGHTHSYSFPNKLFVNVSVEVCGFNVKDIT